MAVRKLPKKYGSQNDGSDLNVRYILSEIERAKFGDSLHTGLVETDLFEGIGREKAFSVFKRVFFAMFSGLFHRPQMKIDVGPGLPSKNVDEEVARQVNRVLPFQ